jgi:hypothetical protein
MILFKRSSGLLMVCDLRSYAGANNTLSRFACLVAVELARAAHNDVPCRRDGTT